MHSEWTGLLSAYLDGELDPREARRLEGHLAECAECRRVRTELEAVIDWAEKFEGRAPAGDPWPSIQAVIDQRRIVALPVGRRAGGTGPGFSWRQLVAAGLLMAVVGGGTVWMALRGGRPAELAQEVAGSPGTLPVAAAPDDLEIRDLEQLLEAGRAVLDTSTVRVVEESLRLIDAAIAEARAAIQRDSTKAYLNGRIAARMRQKLAILRMAARAIGAET